MPNTVSIAPKVRFKFMMNNLLGLNNLFINHFTTSLFAPANRLYTKAEYHLYVNYYK